MGDKRQALKPTPDSQGTHHKCGEDLARALSEGHPEGDAKMAHELMVQDAAAEKNARGRMRHLLCMCRTSSFNSQRKASMTSCTMSRWPGRPSSTGVQRMVRFQGMQLKRTRMLMHR